ncbi:MULTISPECIES: hypothetical protein [unclassified Novosphingobium]|uniref:hypothetical protein n=1 Tax=unclassified Novosphingobium TaxID=2644732 RepID=UPI0006C8C084|nr:MULTISPECIES: hypothetical protein [unclassified Novosphingobium]KPH66982.1 hypothetical protein ADT71_03450 [Novosphingobium sp. ST904]MPS71381.1 hypothetical protein [Novosphingobium sp.]TCM28136.1 hypothetical protein EDF59_13045 [Novosphingobium sp. ST904]
MNVKDAMDGYDYDLPLMDALDNPELSVTRRVLAGAMIGEGVDTAYFATGEMVEAFVALEADARSKRRHGEGFLALEEILTEKNPFQMRLWHLLSEKAIGEAMVDLAWLRGLALQRGRMAKVLREESLPLQYIPERDLVEGKSAAEMLREVTHAKR